AGNEIVNQSFNEVYPAEEILDKSQNTLYQISQVRNNSGFTMISELVRPALNKLEKLHTDKRDVPGQRTGFDAFDSLTAGFQKSDLVIIAARPSMGKTSFALNIAEYVAIEEQKPVIIFSLEMSKESLTMRFLSSVARVDAQNLRKGKFTIAEWQKVTSAVADKISKAPIYIDDSSDINAIEMRARARRLAVQLEAQKTPLAMIVIDYIQIMRGNSGRSESRQQEVAEISRSLKGLARDLKVPVVALSQLSRKTEDRSRKESGNTQPVLSDLRESGAIEQDADLVAFIHYNKDELKNSVDHSIGASIIIGKQRNGPTGEIKLLFESRYTKFSNMDYSFKNEEEQDAV
ncbi:MAG: replicative DNA helicase, partial [Elusimicrobiota bacterium]|nr:replicative DNA helicase [Elusimicrobiota bacterium]